MNVEIKINNPIRVTFPNRNSREFSKEVNSNTLDIDILMGITKSIDILDKLKKLSVNDLESINKIRLVNDGTNNRYNDLGNTYYNKGELILSYLDDNRITISYLGNIIFSGIWKSTKSSRVSYITKIYL